MLKGNKVLLRPVKKSDISHFLKWFIDPEVVQYLAMYLPMTEMAEEKYIEYLGTARARTDATSSLKLVKMAPTGLSGTAACTGST